MTTRRARKKERRLWRRIDRQMRIVEITAASRPMSVKWVGHSERLSFYTNDGLCKRGDHRYWMAKGKKLAERDYRPLANEDHMPECPSRNITMSPTILRTLGVSASPLAVQATNLTTSNQKKERN